MRSIITRAGRIGLAALLSLALLATSVTAVSDAEITVYVTKTGKKYHRESCSSLRKSKIKTTLEQAKKDGYGACLNCSPPK